MAVGPARSPKREILAVIRGIPAGRVVTLDALAGLFSTTVAQIAHVLASLTEDERETTPWHRVVAKGGAIGRGPHREAQFAALMREGVTCSPAGVVHDIKRYVGTSEAALSATARDHTETPSSGQSKARGMWSRPATLRSR